jgi:hypothetical protein
MIKRFSGFTFGFDTTRMARRRHLLAKQPLSDLKTMADLFQLDAHSSIKDTLVQELLEFFAVPRRTPQKKLEKTPQAKVDASFLVEKLDYRRFQMKPAAYQTKSETPTVSSEQKKSNSFIISKLNFFFFFTG